MEVLNRLVNCTTQCSNILFFFLLLRIERAVREGEENHQSIGGLVRKIVSKLKNIATPYISELFDPKESYTPAVSL